MPATRRRVRLALVLAAAAAGCSRGEKSIGDTTSTPIAPPATAAASSTPATSSLALADVAGTWRTRAVPATGSDTTPTMSTLTATGEPTGWKVAFDKGPTVPATASAAGDSITYDLGRYQSARRPGVEVMAHGVVRREGDSLVGTVTARYHHAGGVDSLLTLRTVMTKAP